MTSGTSKEKTFEARSVKMEHAILPTPRNEEGIFHW
jgi:hypothetical protein